MSVDIPEELQSSEVHILVASPAMFRLYVQLLAPLTLDFEGLSEVLDTFTLAGLSTKFTEEVKMMQLDAAIFYHAIEAYNAQRGI